MSAVRVPLRNRSGVIRAYATIDQADEATVNQTRWHLHDGYAIRRSDDGRTVRMHRQIVAPDPGLEVDHINGDRLDNRRSNLRAVTHAQNQQNLTARTGCSSVFRGVSLCRQTGRWKASLCVGYKQLWVGRFGTELAAAQAVETARQQHYTHHNPARHAV